VEFPEVLANENPSERGFSAIVSNPPFQGGQKITGNLGVDYRNFLVDFVAGGRKGSADLCSYFFLQAGRLIRKGGMIGMLATNTIAQGDTREVGLDQLTQNGLTIPRAVASRKWPGSANLEVAQVWLRKGKWESACLLGGQEVESISPYLARPRRVEGNPFRLKANKDKSFQGSNVLGMGFVLSPEEAEELIQRDPDNRSVLFPFLTGDDLNSRPDQSPSRWVINFKDWPLRRADEREWRKAGETGSRDLIREGIVAPDYDQPAAADYPDCLEIVERRVRPERAKLASGDATARDRARRWWQFARPTKKLYKTISEMKQFLIHPLTSKCHSLIWVRPGFVFGHTTIVLAIDDDRCYGLLQSELHWIWALAYGNKLETRPQYTPSDCFETFPFPRTLDSLGNMGKRYYEQRQAIMQSRQECLTVTYNRFHDCNLRDDQIHTLRALQVDMDEAVAGAYGWTDLDLGHDFHETKQGVRFTISEAARREVLDRLLALNHERYKEEVAQGLHETSTKKTKASGNKKRKKKDDSTITMAF